MSDSLVLSDGAISIGRFIPRHT